MQIAIELAERGLVPEPLVRVGIRRLLRNRLRDEAIRHADPEAALARFVDSMARAPIAEVPELANAQHYEVPAAFFQLVLGRQLKYSSGLWQAGVTTLDEAEEAMLALTAARARLADGQRILELGCGWGSLSLWMARRFPASRIVAVSNSAPQRTFIERRARDLSLRNLEVVTADMNAFEPAATGFDRVVSVEMFEHMRNWSTLLGRVRRWLADDGRVFLHVFAHRRWAWPFENRAADDWMGRNFFSGGMMPSADLFERVGSPFAVEERLAVPGTHYARTAEAWRDNLVQRADAVRDVFAQDLGPAGAKRAFERWRMFFLACAELFAYADGTEWLVSHNLLAPRGTR